jgi:hypothetical protein
MPSNLAVIHSLRYKIHSRILICSTVLQRQPFPTPTCSTEVFCRVYVNVARPAHTMCVIPDSPGTELLTTDSGVLLDMYCLTISSTGTWDPCRKHGFIESNSVRAELDLSVPSIWSTGKPSPA